MWTVDFTEPQTSGGETSQREDEAQPGAAEESAGASTGTGEQVPLSSHRASSQPPPAGAHQLFVIVLSFAGSGSAQSGESRGSGTHCCLSTEHQRPGEVCSCCWSPERLLPRRLLRLPGESRWLPGSPGERPAAQSSAAAVWLCCCCRSQPSLGFCRPPEERPRAFLLRLSAAQDLLQIHPPPVSA